MSISNAIYERQRRAVKEFLLDFEKKNDESALTIRLRKVINKSLEPEFSKAFLRYLDRFLREEFSNETDYELIREIEIEIFEILFRKEKILDKKKRYTNYIRGYFDDLIKDVENTRLELRSYLEYRFDHDFDDAFIEIAPDHKVTVNTALWTFSKGGILPVWRYYSPNVYYEDFAKRDEAFDSLNRFQNEYSTVTEVVGNNLNKSFYFDQSQAANGKMEIYQFNMETRTVNEQPTKINASHRIKSKKEDERERTFVFDTIKDYEKNRKEAGKFKNLEKKYQYSVMRWYLRAGILNPLEAYWKKDDKPQNILLNNNLRTPPYYKELLSILNKEDRATNQELNEIIEHIDNTFPGHINRRVAVFDAGFLDLTQQDNDISHIYWMPLVTNWRDRAIGGAFYLNVDKPIELKGANMNAAALSQIHDEDKKKSQLEALRRKLNVLTFYLTGLFDDEQIEELEKLASRENNRAAGVSIIARNISHNLGSHTLSYLKNKMRDEKRMIDNAILAGLLEKTELGKVFVNEEGIDQNKNGKIWMKLDELYFPQLRAIGSFQGHIQERQDYIGAIAAGRRGYYGTVNFKEMVADNLDRPPKRIKGRVHQQQENVLLDHIAYSEGYSRDNIKINFPEEEIAMNDGTKLKYADLEVDLPSGILGRQGIYAILENFIRNTAKHGKKKSDREGKDICIKFEILDFNDKYFEVRITDNSGNTDREVIRIMENSINANLITGEDGRVNEDHKGVKEIQIAAAWLRGLSPADIEDFNNSGFRKPSNENIDVQKTKNDEPDILQVSEESSNLQFKFYIKKTRKVLIVTNKTLSTSLPRGWNILQIPVQGLDKLNKEEDYSHHFILVDDEYADWEGIKTFSSVRVMQYPIDKLNTSLQNKDVVEIETEIYRAWIDANFDSSKLSCAPSEAKIAILDNVGKNDHQGDDRRAEEKQLVFFDDVRGNAAEDAGADIIFRSHNDNRSEFEGFQENNSLYQESSFLEGISGSNSTHRIAREEVITNYWCHKIREAALSKVLIIDERIWNNVVEVKGENKTNRKNRLDFEFEKLQKKGITIANILYVGDSLKIVDVRGEKKGEIGIVDKEGKIQLNPRNSAGKVDVHFISLHQGLLDKMVKYCHENYRNIPNEKIRYDRVFAKFRENLMPIQRYVIHSGRSVTNRIPIGAAFVELSSLETALSDSKFSLSQLLYATTLFNPPN